jgi:LysR family pca operon transcriptional activator
VAAAGILPAALAALHERHPSIAVRLVQGTTDQLLPALAAGEVDLIVGRLYEPALPDSFLREALYEEPMSVLARIGHPILKRTRIGRADLAAYPLVLPTISQRVGQDIERVLGPLGLANAARVTRTSSVNLIREMLLTSDTLTIVPRHILAGDIARGAIAVVPLAFAAPRRPAGIIRMPGRKPSPCMEAFVACLRAAIAVGDAAGHSKPAALRRAKE